MLPQSCPDDQGSPAHPRRDCFASCLGQDHPDFGPGAPVRAGRVQGWPPLVGTGVRGRVTGARSLVRSGPRRRGAQRLRAVGQGGRHGRPDEVSTGQRTRQNNPPGRHHGVSGVVIPPVEDSARYPMIFRRAGITESSWRVVLIMTSEASPGVERSGLRSAKSSITCVIAASNSASGCSVRPRSQRRRT